MIFQSCGVPQMELWTNFLGVAQILRQCSVHLLLARVILWQEFPQFIFFRTSFKTEAIIKWGSEFYPILAGVKLWGKVRMKSNWWENLVTCMPTMNTIWYLFIKLLYPFCVFRTFSIQEQMQSLQKRTAWSSGRTCSTWATARRNIVLSGPLNTTQSGWIVSTSSIIWRYCNLGYSNSYIKGLFYIMAGV